MNLNDILADKRWPVTNTKLTISNWIQVELLPNAEKQLRRAGLDWRLQAIVIWNKMKQTTAHLHFKYSLCWILFGESFCYGSREKASLCQTCPALLTLFCISPTLSYKITIGIEARQLKLTSARKKCVPRVQIIWTGSRISNFLFIFFQLSGSAEWNISSRVKDSLGEGQALCEWESWWKVVSSREWTENDMSNEWNLLFVQLSTLQLAHANDLFHSFVLACLSQHDAKLMNFSGKKIEKGKNRNELQTKHI